MLVVRFIFLFLFSANISLAADVSQFVFTSSMQTISPAQISEKLTIQAQDATGNSVNIPQTACFEFKTTSSTGEFSSSNTNWSPISVLTMSKNTANKNFYYKDATAGNYILTAKIALRPESETRTCASWPVEEWNAQWTAEQNITISDSSSNQASSSQTSQTLESTTVVGWPVEPQIYADAGADKTTVAGADIVFMGKALGLDKEPLDGARFLWSFGDGAIAEGKSVRHVYKYPGEYIVVLDVSSGKYSASDRSMAKIIPNQLEIIGANQNYIKLHNGSNVELDISFWFLRAGNSLFKFPANTFIKTNKDLMIDSSISGISATNSKAELLYPNGSLAASQYVSSPQTPLLAGEGSPQGGVRQEIKKTKIISSSENQTANVISSVQEKDNNSTGAGIGKWLAMASGVGVISAAGLIFVRRKGLL